MAFGLHFLLILKKKEELFLAIYDLTTITPSNIKTGDILNCPYSGTYKIITLPKGQYKLECWGAQGGYRSDSTYGGKGGYSVGTITLTTTTTMYLYSGGAGNTGGANGGFNGGGSRDSYNGGGGASDIRIAANDLQSRVIVAGGGGSDGATNNQGMYGGGSSGGTATQSFGSGGGGGTQTAGGAGGNNNSGSFGNGGKGIYYANGYGGAGGGGWYGGGGAYPDGSGDDDRGGGGGSGFVWIGSNAPSSYRLGSQYYLSNASTIAGNTSFASPTGASETGHTGNGYIRITAIEIKGNLSIYIKNSTWKENNKISFKKSTNENTVSCEDMYIKFNPQSLVPSGYTVLEYIKCEGAQYINTQFIPTGNTRVLLDFETDISDSQALFCGGRTAASGTDKQTFTAFYSVNNKKTIRRDYYGTSKTSTITYNPGRILFDANKNKTYINKNLDSVLSNYTLATSTASVMPIVLFTTCYQTSSSAAITLSNSNWAKYKVYSCKIWDNNIIQRNLIPCKNSSGTLGLYDIINNVFYINAGTGTFTAGPIATISWVKIGNL